MHYIDIDGLKLPIQVIQEKRNNSRVALGTKSIILRVPKRLFGGNDVSSHINWAKDWLLSIKEKKPNLLQKYLPKKEYLSGQTFIIGKHQFMLIIDYFDIEKAKIQLTNNQIKISLPLQRGYDTQKIIQKLLIKLFQKYFLKDITARVNFYNQQYFNQPIESIKLKYNKSNWGSCSTGKNLNFSVRLFFAPDDVIDYVVIHELAHLIEMNHSPKFWKIVHSIMPDYKSKELILKRNSANFDF